jgi:quercetin dioxygenase-like cupin family protein
MKIIHFSEAENKVFDNGPAKSVTGRVAIGKADGANNFCMRVFELGPGGHTPSHTHDWEHEIFVHSGKGAVLREGQWVPVSQGNVVFIPAKEEHQLKNTGDQPFTFVCVIPSGVPEL